MAQIYDFVDQLTLLVHYFHVIYFFINNTLFYVIYFKIYVIHIYGIFINEIDKVNDTVTYNSNSNIIRRDKIDLI